MSERQSPTRIEVLQKTLRVIESCATADQVKTAENYAAVALCWLFRRRPKSEAHWGVDDACSKDPFTAEIISRVRLAQSRFSPEAA